MEADRLLEHWQDEGDFHFLYQQLAQTDKEPDRKEFFTQMAAIERRHGPALKGSERSGMETKRKHRLEWVLLMRP